VTPEVEEMTPSPVNVDFNALDVIEDPFPAYERVRAAGRVVRNELLGVWMVPGYSDVLSVLLDAQRYSSTIYDSDDVAPWFEGVQTMISSDPPEQIRLRKVAQRAFTRASLAKLEETVSQVVDDLLDDSRVRDSWSAGHEVEVMSAFCRPLPTMVISTLLGVPMSDLSMFIAWSDDMIAAVGTGSHQLPDWPQTWAKAKESGLAMGDYLQEQIDRHRQSERDDLINDLLVANEHGILDDRELRAGCILLLLAGNDTTAKLIGSSLLLLARHPDQRQLLADRPDLVPGAVEEVLRFHGVPQAIPRLVTEDSTLIDVDIKAGEVVYTLIAAANRDPEVFADPSRFDVTRSPNRHVGFGHGVHNCLGTMLARMEARIALTGFLSRSPGYEVRAATYWPIFQVRGLQDMRVCG
jgi:cytochrome P450